MAEYKLQPSFRMPKPRDEILQVIKIITSLGIKKKGKYNFSSMLRGVKGDSSHQLNKGVPAL